MPRTTSVESAMVALTQEFVRNIAATVESVVAERIRGAVMAAMPGAALRRGPGRPPKNPLLAPTALTLVRRKAPRQLCPVPGCKNPAAPVFGMVCAKHKDVPKAKIKEYREKRRAAKGKRKTKKAA
jgi:hypothetical protein